jgi:two-component system copper resistance phosphate regulon response regulator CusR
MKVLVIEDEQQVASLIKQGLEEQSIEVDVAYDGNIGERLVLSREYQVVLLDIVLPGINGFDLCRTIKKERPILPVLMLTTLGTTSDKLSGFDAGADDYLQKPFEFAELIARVQALARRPSASGIVYNDTLIFEDLRLDISKKMARRHNKSIKLSAKEFSLLEYFMTNPGRVISRAELAEKIWNVTFETNTNVVEVYMNMLRNKIDKEFEPKLLQTRIGMGYVLSKD